MSGKQKGRMKALRSAGHNLFVMIGLCCLILMFSFAASERIVEGAEHNLPGADHHHSHGWFSEAATIVDDHAAHHHAPDEHSDGSAPDMPHHFHPDGKSSALIIAAPALDMPASIPGDHVQRIDRSSADSPAAGLERPPKAILI